MSRPTLSFAIPIMIISRALKRQKRYLTACKILLRQRSVVLIDYRGSELDASEYAQSKPILTSLLLVLL